MSQENLDQKNNEKFNQNNTQKMLSDAEVQRRRNVANNANNVRLAADVASKTANPYAKAAGVAIKTADKISGGKASEKLGKTLNTYMKTQGLKGKMMQAAMNKMSESGTSNRIAAAANQKNKASIGQSTPKTGTLSANNVESSSSKLSETTESSDGGSESFNFSLTIVKIGLFCCASLAPIVIIICLFMTSSQIMIKSVGLGSADSLSNEDVESKINKKQKNSEDLSEEADEDDLSFDFFIDNPENNFRETKLQKNNLVQIASTTYLKRKYNEADLDNLEDFYPNVRDLSNKYDENLVYDFFFKMYKLYTFYREKYNVNIDLPLLMSTLSIQSTDMGIVFSSNLSSKDRKKTERTNFDDFDYYYDWSGYKLSPDNSTHDMEILVQHMISKQVKETCKDSNGKEIKMNILKDDQIGTQVLVCDEGQSYEAGQEYYAVDNDKYKEFLKEFIEKKYYESGTVTSPTDDTTTNTDNSSSIGPWSKWKQCGESWSNIIVPKSSSTMCRIGCLITSVTIQIARSGTAIVTDSIDPGIAVKKYSFLSDGDFIWGSASNLAPNFKYKTVISLAGMSKSSIAKKLSSYDSNKYYIILAVSKKERNDIHHYVALDYVDTQTSDLYMFDPGTSDDPKLYSTYKVYKAHIYEKKD